MTLTSFAYWYGRKHSIPPIHNLNINNPHSSMKFTQNTITFIHPRCFYSDLNLHHLDPGNSLLASLLTAVLPLIDSFHPVKDFQIQKLLFTSDLTQAPETILRMVIGSFRQVPTPPWALSLISSPESPPHSSPAPLASGCVLNISGASPETGAFVRVLCSNLLARMALTYPSTLDLFSNSVFVNDLCIYLCH